MKYKMDIRLTDDSEVEQFPAFDIGQNGLICLLET